jgi:hypothetical protein
VGKENCQNEDRNQAIIDMAESFCYNQYLQAQKTIINADNLVRIQVKCKQRNLVFLQDVLMKE